MTGLLFIYQKRMKRVKLGLPNLSAGCGVGLALALVCYVWICPGAGVGEMLEYIGILCYALQPLLKKIVLTFFYFSYIAFYLYIIYTQRFAIQYTNKLGNVWIHDNSAKIRAVSLALIYGCSLYLAQSSCEYDAIKIERGFCYGLISMGAMTAVNPIFIKPLIVMGSFLAVGMVVYNSYKSYQAPLGDELAVRKLPKILLETESQTDLSLLNGINVETQTDLSLLNGINVETQTDLSLLQQAPIKKQIDPVGLQQYILNDVNASTQKRSTISGSTQLVPYTYTGKKANVMIDLHLMHFKNKGIVVSHPATHFDLELINQISVIETFQSLILESNLRAEEKRACIAVLNQKYGPELSLIRLTDVQLREIFTEFPRTINMWLDYWNESLLPKYQKKR